MRGGAGKNTEGKQGIGENGLTIMIFGGFAICLT
jgi:hypothetical protein